MNWNFFVVSWDLLSSVFACTQCYKYNGWWKEKITDVYGWKCVWKKKMKKTWSVRPWYGHWQTVSKTWLIEKKWPGLSDSDMVTSRLILCTNVPMCGVVMCRNYVWCSRVNFLKMSFLHLPSEFFIELQDFRDTLYMQPRERNLA